MNTRTTVLALMAVVPVVLVAGLALLFVPHFREVFDAFGSELPLATRILLATYPWFGLLALFVAILAWQLRRNAEHLARLVIAAWIASFLLFGIALAACYMPIFRIAGTT